VRALVIEFAAEAIELPLLGLQAARWRHGGFMPCIPSSLNRSFHL